MAAYSLTGRQLPRKAAGLASSAAGPQDGEGGGESKDKPGLLRDQAAPQPNGSAVGMVPLLAGRRAGQCAQAPSAADAGGGPSGQATGGAEGEVRLRLGSAFPDSGLVPG